MMTGKDKQGVLIIIGVSVVFLFLFALSYKLKASADNYDPETLCRNDGDYPVLKLLIDKTDPWTGQGRERLAALIRRIKGGLAEHERFSIFVLDENGLYSPSPVFDMCNPGRGDQANSLYENPRLVQQQFEKKFQAPLDSMLDELLRPGVAAETPLLETVVGLRGEEDNARLMLVSDMMQNSESLSLYRKHGTDIINGKVNDLCESPKNYKSVEVYYINRSQLTVSTRQEARNFWDQCFNRMADNLSWEAL